MTRLSVDHLWNIVRQTIGVLRTNPIILLPALAVLPLAGMMGFSVEGIIGNPGNIVVRALLWLLVTLFVFLATMVMADSSVTGQCNLASALGQGIKNLPLVLVATVMSVVLIAVGSLLFIVPGIVFAIKMSYVPQAIMFDKKGLFEAFSYSWKITGGHEVALFWLALAWGVGSAALGYFLEVLLPLTVQPYLTTLLQSLSATFMVLVYRWLREAADGEIGASII
ncbi:MAG: hypothetical protein KGZ50_10140 [Peptococcaceae bacterium]|nr:hypothetical protein [Peptococcaceae bacterium]